MEEMGLIGEREKNLEMKAMAEMKRNIRDHVKCFKDLPEQFDDGDQSPLTGEKGMEMGHQWFFGMDYVPYNPDMTHLSEWMKTVFRGDYDAMMQHIKKIGLENTSKMLEIRETLLKVSTIFHVIMGARVFYGNMNNPTVRGHRMQCETVMNVKLHDVKILKKLISLGAKINVHDVAGYIIFYRGVKII